MEVTFIKVHRFQKSPYHPKFYAGEVVLHNADAIVPLKHRMLRRAFKRARDVESYADRVIERVRKADIFLEQQEAVLHRRVQAVCSQCGRSIYEYEEVWATSMLDDGKDFCVQCHDELESTNAWIVDDETEASLEAEAQVMGDMDESRDYGEEE